MRKDTACAACEHYNDLGYHVGVCRHPDGPTGKVLKYRWVYDNTLAAKVSYPKGCPVDPNPKLVRIRPKKKKGSKPAPFQEEYTGEKDDLDKKSW